MGSLLFYNNLVSHEQSVNELLSQPDAFRQVPKDWQIIVTDIKGSTMAVKSGMFELVNLVATGSIIAALNIALKTKVIIAALEQHRKNVKKEFNIDLRVGSVAVSSVYENDCELKIAKVSINPLYTIPIVLGSGLYYAEKVIKLKDIDSQQSSNQSAVLSLEGMECG